MENVTELIDRLRSFPTETEYIEFKRNYSEAGKEGADISALANSAAYCGVRAAYKVWGIDDGTHEVVGTSFSPRREKKGNQSLELWLRLQLSDNANFEFAEVSYRGFPIVVLKIWPALHHPVEFQNVAYIRTDSSTQKIKSGSAREAELWRRIQQEVFEDQCAKEDTSLEDVLSLLDCNVYFDLLGIPRPGNSETVLHYLEQDGLAFRQDDGRVAITNLGAVLFARNLSNFGPIGRKALRVIRYEGRGRAGDRSEREFSRGYALDLESILLFIDGMVRPVEAIEGAKRVTKPTYPAIALRELVINALIHQDFTITGTGPMVEVFNERIEITNPGSLLVEADRIVNDPPRSRNEKMSALMRRFGFCEEAGSGWDKIVGGCEDLRLPAPRIDANSSVRITLSQSKSFKDLTPDEKLNSCYLHACLNYSEGLRVTNSSLRERFGVEDTNAAQVSRLIKLAVESGLIKPVNPDTSPRYMQYVPFWA